MTMAAVTGIGYWLPETVRTNEEWPEDFGRHARKSGDRTFNDIEPSEDAIAAAITLRHLEEEASDPFLGAVERRVAPDDMTSYQAEAYAAQAAIADAGIEPEDVDLILCQAITPDTLSGPAAGELAHRIGAKNAHAMFIDTACAISVAMLEVSKAFVISGLARTVLCTQSHLLLRAAPLLHPATPGLGNIATAYVVSDAPGVSIRSTFNLTHGEFATAVRWLRGRTPEQDVPWFRGCEEDFRLGTYDRSQVKYLMRETVNFGARSIREAAERGDVDVADIDVVCSVQPRGFIPGAIAERLGLARDAAISTYPSIAHVGACGPVYNLWTAREQGRLTTGTTIAMYGQGGGFSRSAAILTVD